LPGSSLALGSALGIAALRNRLSATLYCLLREGAIEAIESIALTSSVCGVIGKR
jgi:hypothetical protein